MSVDPLSHAFSWNSPYAFAENDVIRAIDLEGAEKGIVIYSPLLAGKAKEALKLKNYKEVMRIFEYASTHSWVDENGKKSDYHQRLYEKMKGGRNFYKIPMNQSATYDWRDKDRNNTGMINRYGEQSKGKGWLRVEFFNIETEQYELLGIIPIAKINSDGVVKDWKFDKTFFNIEPTFSKQNKKDLLKNKGIQLLDFASSPINPMPFEPQGYIETEAKIQIEARLRTLGPDNRVILPITGKDGVEGIWYMESYSDDKGVVNYREKSVLMNPTPSSKQQ